MKIEDCKHWFTSSSRVLSHSVTKKAQIQTYITASNRSAYHGNPIMEPIYSVLATSYYIALHMCTYSLTSGRRAGLYSARST